MRIHYSYHKFVNWALFFSFVVEERCGRRKIDCWKKLLSGNRLMEVEHIPLFEDKLKVVQRQQLQLCAFSYWFIARKRDNREKWYHIHCLVLVETVHGTLQYVGLTITNYMSGALEQLSSEIYYFLTFWVVQLVSQHTRLLSCIVLKHIYLVISSWLWMWNLWALLIGALLCSAT